MALLLVHLSDAHLRSKSDPLIQRANALALTVASECDSNVTSIVLAFTGDATDKGYAPGFEVAREFLANLKQLLQRETNIDPDLFVIPGNHDLVMPEDASLRDVAINGLVSNVTLSRPKPAIENAVMEPLQSYFDFVNTLNPTGSPDAARPFYLSVDREISGSLVRFHLLNTSWMCKGGQGPGSLVFPVEEIKPTTPVITPIYEIALLHHPFNWFKQPEVMRPLRDAIENIGDMILTGHEHVGRPSKVSLHGWSEFEYREGEALQDESSGKSSAFHVMRIDFDADSHRITTYRWDLERSGGTFVKTGPPATTTLGRNERRANLAYRLRPRFFDSLNDPELPVMHARAGKLSLSEFYVYPDLTRMSEKADKSPQLIKGEKLVGDIIKIPRSLILGSDRSGKTSLAKRLFADLHQQGWLPLLIRGDQVVGFSADKLARRLETQILEQYDVGGAEEYWQFPKEKRVIILDDFHLGPKEPEFREALLSELEVRFGRIIIIGGLEYFLDDFLGDSSEESRKSNSLWKYEQFRILAFGYMRTAQFVKKWVKLDNAQDHTEQDKKAREIVAVLSQYLRTNAIPQHPWVVLVIVQLADTPDAPLAQSGSYGYLLQSLITAALSKSRIRLPINGKYRWLGELANELYRQKVECLPDSSMRSLHQRYRVEFGVGSVDYVEIRDDLLAAGVLRVEEGDVSFRQPYTYCYFVAWHLTQRIHSGDQDARKEVQKLCESLYHEDSANILVFLAHLSSSHLVIEEMTNRAATLFLGVAESDFVSDVAAINGLYGERQSVSLPQGDPSKNRQIVAEQQDDRKAAIERDSRPGRTTTPATSQSVAKKDGEFKYYMEIVTSFRTIEILGQVLRNEATARKVPELVTITDHIFKLGRRLLGFVFTRAEERLDDMASALMEYQSNIKPDAEKEDLEKEVNRKLFNRYLITAYSVVKYVASAVGDRHLGDVFRRLVEDDPNLANRLYMLAIDIDLTAANIPIQHLRDLRQEVTGGKKGGKAARSYNNLAYTLIRLMFVDYLYLNRVPAQRMQSLCTELEIGRLPSANNPAQKRLPPK